MNDPSASERADNAISSIYAVPHNPRELGELKNAIKNQISAAVEAREKALTALGPCGIHSMAEMQYEGSGEDEYAYCLACRHEAAAVAKAREEGWKAGQVDGARAR
jgi:hypothetical protein